MAGLPKTVFVLLLTLGIAITLAVAGVAEDVQTGSVVLPPVDVQTPSNILQPVFDLIDANLFADPIDQANLKADFESAVTLGVLTPEQAMAMLGLVQWETLVELEALANAAAAIQTVLADLISGALTGDPIAALTQLLNALATPAGTLTAIGKAGASEEILDQVASLVAGGVPPGIVVRITKEGLRKGLSMERIEELLDALAEAIAEGEELSWGQIANVISDMANQQEEVAPVEEDEEPQQEEGDASEQGESDDSNDNNGKKGSPPRQDDKKDK